MKFAQWFLWRFVFQNVMVRIIIEGCRRYGGICRFHHQGGWNDRSCKFLWKFGI